MSCEHVEGVKLSLAGDRVFVSDAVAARGCDEVTDDLMAPLVIVGAASWSGFRPDKIKAVASARAIELYVVPADPMDELESESCQ